MTNVYELADNDRGKLIFEKDQLLAPLQEGMLAAPHPMADGLEERDYYQGKVASAADARAAGVGRRPRADRAARAHRDATER